MSGLVARIRKITRSRFCKSDSGVTAIEFAMVGPPFFMILFAIFETGLMLFSEYVLQTSVQEAAREIRTGQAQSQQLTAAAFKTKICSIANVIMDCESAVTVYVSPATTFTALAGSMPSYLDVGLKADGTKDAVPYSCGGPSQAVGVMATYDWDFVVPWVLDVGLGNVLNHSARRLRGVAIFKNEPFPAGSSCS